MTPVDLMRYPSLRCTTIICFLLSIMLTLSIDGPALVLRDLPVNIYLNAAITGSAEIVSTLVSLLIIENLPRRRTQLGGWAVSAIIAALLFVFLPCMDEDHCGLWSKRIQTAGIFLYRMTTSATLNAFILSKTEIFPAQIKIVALQTEGIGNSLAFLFVPPVQSYLESVNVSVLILFVVIGVIGAILTCWLKETKDIPPP